MKLPEKIKGRNRIRDGAMVLYFKRDELDFIDLAKKFELTEMRIRQILAKNHAFIKVDKEWEKEKRINRLRRRLKETGAREDFIYEIKDEIALQAELRKEINDGEESSSRIETKVIIIRDTNGNQNTDRNVPGQVSVHRV